MATSGRWIRVLNIIMWVLAGLFVACLAAAGYLYSVVLGLPDFSAVSALPAARTSVVYASDGSVIATWHGEQDRTIVPLSKIPRDLRDAAVGAEDPGFYAHRGVDTGAVFAALFGGGARGATTITQQLARMLLAEDKGSGVQWKIRRALLTNKLEATTSKDRVLEEYLNLVYFGNGHYGVESASQSYFGKPAASLTLAETALLAGIIRAPSRYAPVANPAAARVRRDEVLTRMRQLSFITTAEESASKREPIVLKSSAIASSSVAPYFVEYVKQQLIDRLGAERVFTGGLRITTTLVPGLQTAAEQAGRASLPSTSDPETAIVVLDPRDGGILAMVGGRDFARAQYNLAAQGRRQPGSAFKPFLLVAALEKGVSPDRTFQTAPFSVRVKDGVWNVENYENGFTSGAITLRTATDWSVNGVFARLVMEIGAQRVVDAAKRMGITSPLEPNPAIALGGLSHGVSPLEMASAYGTLATGGVQTPPLAVTKVTDDRGRIVYEGKPKPVRVVSKQVSSTASGMLREVVDRGTGLNARIARPASGKTGTTQSYRDAWFVGYTGDLVAAVWVGYRQAQVAMTNIHGIKVTGGSFPAIIWARLAGSPAGLLAAEGKSAAPRAEAASEVATLGVGVTDSSLVRVRICQDSLMRANPRCPRVVEMDLPAYAVPPVCTVH